jgi:GNAT superfamily N-acetyltransferase
VGLLVRLAGVADLGDFWVALGEDEAVVGTIGLYRNRKDAHEAVWLSWFTVAPDERGQGLGGRLLDFAIERARASGVSYLRLYTGTDPIMAKAQQVYESRVCTCTRRRTCSSPA